MNTKNILVNWSLNELGKDARPNQIKILNWLSKQTAKFVIIQAPTGLGKSPVGMTYSAHLNNGIGNAFILTPQKILQKQYENSFSHKTICSLYGKSNYSCEKAINCDIGDVLKPKCTSCPYKQQLQKSKQSTDLVLNYSLALSMFKYSPEFYKPRKLMIMDECHTLEKHLTDFDSIDINEFRSRQMNFPITQSKDFKVVIKWIKNEYYDQVENKLTQLCKLTDIIKNSNPDELNKTDLDLLQEEKDLQSHFDDLTEIFKIQKEEVIERDYVLITDENNTALRVKRLTGKSGFEKLLLPMAERFLFMSATIIDVDEFCDNLGLDKTEVAFIDMDSDFPAENRPVLYIPTMRVNKDWQKNENKSHRDFLVNTVKDILQLHGTDSGIIHSGNFKMSEWLVKELENNIDHLIFHHNPNEDSDSQLNRDEVIEKFIKCKKPAILISPSITEGLDLVDDLSRFAIFTKVPYLSLGDQWVAKRFNLSQQWYSLQALINVIQGCGRVVRSANDKGSVYILDSSWEILYNKSKHKIPNWWKEAYSVLK